jgi:hypothetical protein
MIAGALVAWRRRDGASLALLAFAGIANVLAIAAIRAIMGEEERSLLFWTTAISALGWIGALSSLGSALAATVARQRLPERAVAAAATTALAVFALTTSGLERAWIAAHPHAPASDPSFAPARREVYELLRAQPERPVLHLAGAWEVTTTLLLEADRDGVDFRLADSDRWAFPAARGPTADAGAERPIWFEEQGFRTVSEPCVEVVAQVNHITLLGPRDDCRPRAIAALATRTHRVGAQPRN